MSDSGAAPGEVATAIRIDSVVTPSITLPDTPDTPTIWVAADTPFDVSATTVDSTGAPAPLSFTKDVTVNIRAVTDVGNVNLGSIVVPKDTTAIFFTRTLSADIDNAFIQLTSVERKTDPVRTGSSDTFDVQSEFSDTQGVFDIAIGGIVDGATCTPTVSEKLCFELHFPPGSLLSNHLLSLGNCDFQGSCRDNLDYWWSLVDVDETVTSVTPVIVDMGIDKSLKGVFANSVVKARWAVRPSGEETFVDAPDCPGKGVIGPDQDFCQDTSAGHRDNSGDTWIRLLWKRDLRGSLK